MSDDSHSTLGRALRILGVLQTGEAHDAPHLAARLGVTERTIRRDVARLRGLGYPVNAVHGAGGGYRLGTGGRLPPLLLDEDEALATVVSLRLAAGGTIDAVAESAVSALGKIAQSMPPVARERAVALAEATAAIPASSPSVSGHTLMTLATAVRRGAQVRFAYTRRDGRRSLRRAEPYALVSLTSRWYLMAWDLDRGDWRSFRLDRMTDLAASTFTFTSRQAPDARDFVRSGVSGWSDEITVDLRVAAPAETIRPRLPRSFVAVESDGPGACRVTFATSDLDAVPYWMAGLGADFEVVAPRELRVVLREAGERLVRAGRETEIDGE